MVTKRQTECGRELARFVDSGKVLMVVFELTMKEVLSLPARTGIRIFEQTGQGSSFFRDWGRFVF